MRSAPGTLPPSRASKDSTLFPNPIPFSFRQHTVLSGQPLTPAPNTPLAVTPLPPRWGCFRNTHTKFPEEPDKICHVPPSAGGTVARPQLTWSEMHADWGQFCRTGLDWGQGHEKPREDLRFSGPKEPERHSKARTDTSMPAITHSQLETVETATCPRRDQDNGPWRAIRSWGWGGGGTGAPRYPRELPSRAGG